MEPAADGTKCGDNKVKTETTSCQETKECSLPSKHSRRALLEFWPRDYFFSRDQNEWYSKAQIKPLTKIQNIATWATEDWLAARNASDILNPAQAGVGKRWTLNENYLPGASHTQTSIDTLHLTQSYNFTMNLMVDLWLGLSVVVLQRKLYRERRDSRERRWRLGSMEKLQPVFKNLWLRSFIHREAVW